MTPRPTACIQLCVTVSKHSLSSGIQGWKIHLLHSLPHPDSSVLEIKYLMQCLSHSPLHCKFIPSFSTIFHAVSNFFGPNSQAAESMLPRVHRASQLNKSVATTALTMTNVFAMTRQTSSRPEGDSPLHDDPYAKISCPKPNQKAFPESHI